MSHHTPRASDCVAVSISSAEAKQRTCPHRLSPEALSTERRSALDGAFVAAKRAQDDHVPSTAVEHKQLAQISVSVDGSSSGSGRQDDTKHAKGTHPSSEERIPIPIRKSHDLQLCKQIKSGCPSAV